MMERERFEALAERYLNGSLDEAAGAELLHAIEESPELRTLLHAHVTMDMLLKRRFRTADGASKGAMGRRVRAALRDPTQKKGAITRIMEKLPEKGPKKNAPHSPVESAPVPQPRGRFRHFAAAAAALVAVTAGVLTWSLLREPGAEERAWALPKGAEAVATATPESGSAQVLRNGRVLPLTQTRQLISTDVLTTGAESAVVLAYPDNTRVKIPGEAKLELQPAKLKAEAGIGIDLARGTMDAEVVPQAKPMIVLTPQGRAEVVGTHFVLATTAAESRVEVLEGKVRVSRAASPESILIQKGEMAVVAPELKLEAMPAWRDPALWPFSAKSAWNHPMGTGARFLPVESPRFNVDKGVTIAADEDSIPIYIATAADPVRTIFRTTPDKAKPLHIPHNAKPEPSLNRYMNVIDEKHHRVFELKGTTFLPDGTIKVSQDVYYNSVQENAGVYSNDKRHGSRAYGGSSLGGIIRKGELAGGIRHALGIGVTVHALNQNTPTGRPYVWPASTAAILWEQTYGKTGNLHLGSLLAIPPNVDLAKIGVGTSGPAYELARALQDYGAYIVDHVDDAPTDVRFYLEPAAKGELPKTLEGQLAQLARYLQVVVNNSPTTVGGGGKPRRAFAPPFSKEYVVSPEAAAEKP